MSSWVMRDSFEQIYFYVKERRALHQKLDYEVYLLIFSLLHQCGFLIHFIKEKELGIRLNRKVTWKQNLLETVVILGISILIAIVVPKITIVFGLVGSTSSVTLNFILPGLMCIEPFPFCGKCAFH